MRAALGWMVILICVSSVHGSEFSTGPNGINSRALGLTGNGVAIGQVEPGRPGMPMKNGMPFDDAAWIHNQVKPANVFAGTADDTANSAHVIYQTMPLEPEETREGLHATQVAGIMIADASTPSLQGVAPGASLYATAINGAPINLSADQRFAMSANRIATLPEDVRAINVSAGRLIENFLQLPDGNQHATQFVDWSTNRHDVLYVLGGAHTVPADIPQDNFNGITVGASDRLAPGGAFQKVADLNTYEFDAEPGVRTTIDLIAPGVDIIMTGQGSVPSIADGTSFAAPHATGTVALLQEWANLRIGESAPRWSDNAKEPEVMKAILLNSADKLANVHGSTRDIFQKDGLTKWTQTLAGMDPSVSLDEQMGAGHLNAKSAFDNFKVGEHEAGVVPLIGWDFGTVGFLNNVDYTFNRQASGWVAITLAWNRFVLKSSDTGYLPTDLFDPYAPSDEVGLSSVLSNLDVFLINTDDNSIVHSSETTTDNLEHIFFEVGPGNYKIQVSHFGGGHDDAQEYALAWWAGNITPGDFDGDGDVDGDDLNQWKDDYGQNGRSDANGDGVSDGADFMIWQRNFGTGVPAVAANSVVPEPSALVMLLLGLPLLLRNRSA